MRSWSGGQGKYLAVGNTQELLMSCRKIFGKSHRQDLMQDVVSQMSVSALAAQRKEMEEAVFDSD
jgi:hypothetical protein